MVFQFHLVRHPLDGLSLLLDHLKPKEDGLFWTLPGEPLRAFGCTGLKKGLSGLLQGRAEWGQIKGQQGNISVLAPTEAEMHFPLAEWIDRLRQCTSGPQNIQVVILYEKTLDHLPFLESGDSLLCYWELHDVLSADCLQHFERLAERMAAGRGCFAGVQLYSRGRPNPEREQELRDILHSLADHPVRTCKEGLCHIR